MNTNDTPDREQLLHQHVGPSTPNPSDHHRSGSSDRLREYLASNNSTLVDLGEGDMAILVQALETHWLGIHGHLHGKQL